MLTRRINTFANFKRLGNQSRIRLGHIDFLSAINVFFEIASLNFRIYFEKCIGVFLIVCLDSAALSPLLSLC